MEIRHPLGYAGVIQKIPLVQMVPVPERVVGSRTVRGRKPSIERHKDVLERVLELTNRPSVPNHARKEIAATN